MISKRALLGTFFAVTVVAGSVGLVAYRNKSFIPFFKASEFDQKGIGEKVIVKVGEESLYQKDLDYELSLHPQKDDPKTKDVILQKMINDSIILQGAKSENVVPVTSDIFNSASKDYDKRITTISAIKKAVAAKSEHTKGTVISIWFRNNDYVGPLGLEKSKKIAQDKMTTLHDRIVAGEITIEEAGELIKKDTTLAQIDKAWTNNALFHFDVVGDQRISFSTQFDAILRDLKPGEISDVYLARNVDTDPNKRYEALYYVGQVTEKTNTGNLSGFDSWLSSKKKLYGITN
jgi:hypothetical protein